MVKKYFVFGIITVLAASLLTGCGGWFDEEPPETTNGRIYFNTSVPGNETPKNPSEETETERPSEIPTPETTLAPTSEPTPSEPTPYVDKFIDVWATEQVYVVPNVKTEIKFSGNPQDWVFDNNSTFTHKIEGGKLYVTASTTGYVNLKTSSGKKAVIFSNLAVEKTAERKATDGLPYYLYYEKGTHTLTVYTKDNDGYYTVPFRTICTASGSTPTKTPTGIHELGTKVRWKDFGKNCKAQYGISYASGVFLHGPCYEFERENSILSHYYNTIGENSTGGCLRMQTGYIYWIYYNCETGTKLEIVNGNPRGTSVEIPEDIPEAACYDPTDPIIKDRV